MCNSSSIGDNIVILAALRGGTAFLYVIINTVLLMVIWFRLEKNTPIHRLLIYLTTSSLLALITNIFQVESMGCLSFWHEPVCKSVSFLNHFTAWILMLIVFWIASVLAIHYWCSGCKGVFNFKTDIIDNNIQSIDSNSTYSHRWLWDEPSLVLDKNKQDS